MQLFKSRHKISLHMAMSIALCAVLLEFSGNGLDTVSFNAIKRIQEYFSNVWYGSILK